jgi:hypothetical protein
MPDPFKLTVRGRQTIRAALLFWREENVPHFEIQRHYFDTAHPDPLSGEEVDQLRCRLNQSSPE